MKTDARQRCDENGWHTLRAEFGEPLAPVVAEAVGVEESSTVPYRPYERVLISPDDSKGGRRPLIANKDLRGNSEKSRLNAAGGGPAGSRAAGRRCAAGRSLTPALREHELVGDLP